MGQAQPIIIGDVFERTYTRYASDGVTPINFTGEPVVFAIVQGTTRTTYTEGAGDLVVTANLGKVEVHLTDEKTALLVSGVDTISYLEFTQADGDIYTRGRISRERIHTK